MSLPVSQQQQPLPASATNRLAGSQQNGKQFFTSDLSVNEFVLTQQTGFEPVGMVMGSCFYHVGIQPSRWSVSQELTVLSQAMYTCRELAMARMEAEADALGADGVVGVQLRSLGYVFAGDVLEFIAVGTAIKSSDGKSYRTPAGRPFTSHLSGQDFWTLLAPRLDPAFARARHLRLSHRAHVVPPDAPAVGAEHGDDAVQPGGLRRARDRDGPHAIRRPAGRRGRRRGRERHRVGVAVGRARAGVLRARHRRAADAARRRAGAADDGHAARRHDRRRPDDPWVAATSVATRGGR